MWQTDTVTIQSGEDVNTNGSIKTTWTDAISLLCDVQNISKELVNKNYGFTDAQEYKQVFDLNEILEVLGTFPLESLYPEDDLTPSEYQVYYWVVGNQVKYKGEQYLIRLVDDSENKMGASNHIFVIMSRVI